MPNFDNPYLTFSETGVVVKRNTWWTEEGQKLSDEEKEKVQDEMWEKVKADQSDVIMIPRSQMEAITQALKELKDMGQMDVRTWMEMDPKEAALRHKVRELSEFPYLFADQCMRMNAPIDKGFPTTAYDAPFVENNNE